VSQSFGFGSPRDGVAKLQVEAAVKQLKQLKQQKPDSSRNL
jgi:hypothetical protein